MHENDPPKEKQPVCDFSNTSKVASQVPRVEPFDIDDFMALFALLEISPPLVCWYSARKLMARRKEKNAQNVAHSSSSGWSKRKLAASSSFLSQAKYA